MNEHTWLISPIPISTLLLLVITATYLLSYYYRSHPTLSMLSIAFNYLPVLTHEFGHVLFNRLSGGRVVDFVVVMTRKERQATGQQGYAVTQSKSRIGQTFTTLGGYIMPPLMLSIGLIMQSKGQGVIFILLYIGIFLYFTIVTSRKMAPFIIIILLCSIVYLGLQSENLQNYSFIYMLVYHWLLGTLLGETIQSSITIAQLTFTRPQPNWDGTALRDLTHVPTLCFSTLWILLNAASIYFLCKQLFL
ncbi:M50 family metallopeptidase [Staphylococcus americanisciuri]|uniref:M50 family metallopeptidase n=1 Tax=Staphylococcus americanisciuri TaxID=2973940 RepID=A0ABT2F3V2_9STAP|nr:M50 family metallopeptidase [Staphylococcus americanisciuri]MCS4486492.1 M50 family metallopeptidase [Staphylococcus americanisciuri]